ncbi:hypothetical protein GTO27_02220 [Candidatus Bathyarchaeota archaeon]|nr:hypothetical protein [Candidatus Bathyarchaeota archaeon]
MPQLVICQKCSFVLYKGEELKPPYEIIGSYDGDCPNCGKKLSYMPKTVEIKLVDRIDA